LAIWFYGRPIFADEGQEKSQKIYNKLVAKAFERIYPLKGTPMQPAFVTLASWLDNVAFPLETWSDVQRIKWNHDQPLSFLGEEFFDFNVDHESRVSSGEKVEERIDREFWAKEDCGIEWVKGFVDAQFPWKNKDDRFDAQLKPMYEELEEAMGGRGSKTKIAWPVVLILATKK